MNRIKNLLIFALFFTVSAISIKSKIENDKLYILIGEESFLINLIENSVTQELINILPMKIKLQNENISSINLSLTIQIDTSNLEFPTTSQIKANKGDLILFKGKQIILLNKDTILINENGDYLKIGYTKDVDNLFNSISKNKKMLLWNTLNYENNLGKVKPYGYYTSIMNYFTWKIFTFFCFLLL